MISAESGRNTAPDFLAERITAVFEASGNYAFEAEGGSENLYWSSVPQGVSSFDAEIYFHYKLDKPHHLVLRVVRQLFLWPLLKRQVAYNHSIRSAILRLWHERADQRRELNETRARVAELEKKIALLSGKGNPS